jgi:hypothetical protein
MVEATKRTYQINDSETESVSKIVLIALAGTTGAGKTESAMRLARGIVGEAGKFCVIDTENKRALNKKTRYRFGHIDLKPPYSPDNFKGAIEYAEKSGYGAIVVDNFSHEWFGEGGCSDMQEEVLERITKGDMSKAERLTALAWKEPKRAHKKLIYRLLQCPVPIIFCLRAEPKIKFVKDATGKTQMIDAGWQPICEKMFSYDMLVYALLMPDNPGVPVHLKKLEAEFEPMFPIGKQITELCGKQLAEWAGGGVSNPAESKPIPATGEQIAALKALMAGAGMTDDDDQRKFWSFVLPKGKNTTENAQEWADNFDAKLREYYNFIDQQAAKGTE